MSDCTMPCPAAKPGDYASDQEVKWCPGCGDYSILAQTRKILAKLGVERSNTVFVSGIGCSSRFPYYMNTYGFHGIHGRAPAIATGVKIARPDLDVWVVTGDGDALAIGGNHFIHAIRRNVNLKILLFNNRIYGLTKGQYSPTSERGKVTKSSPMGVPDTPLRPTSVALASEATFVARAADTDLKNLEYVLERAAQHRGTAFVEIYQNCLIFNDGAWDYARGKETKGESLLYLRHGMPLIFGKDNDKGIRLREMSPEVVDLRTVPADDLLCHDETADDPSLAFMLSRMRCPEFPEPMGVFRAVQREEYADVVHGQIRTARAKRTDDLQALLTGEETWTVS